MIAPDEVKENSPPVYYTGEGIANDSEADP